ncbi:MAG: HAMP domain-containing histidine kinase [Clostridia bacterium]|nr:HAMP domain-containing histidine kinase [Clostridia bacterium]
MDTKSKKFSYSITLKTICFLLSCLFTFIGTVSILSLGIDVYEKEAVYNDAMRSTDSKNLTSSYSFSEICKNHLSAIMLKSLYFKDGSLNTFKKVAKSVIDKEYNGTLNYCMSTDVDSLEDKSYATLTYLCDGYFEYASENPYKNSNDEVVKVPKGADRIYFSNGSIYSVKLDKKLMYEQVVENLSRNFYRQASENSKTLSKIKNLKYVIINNTDKTFYTNVETLNNKSTSEQIAEYFSSYGWNFHDNSSGKSSFGPDVFAQSSDRYESDYSAGIFGYYNILSTKVLVDTVEGAVQRYTADQYGYEISSADNYEIYAAFDENLSAEDEYFYIQMNIFSASRNILQFVVLFSICAVLVAASLIFLTVKAGRKEKGGEITLLPTDKVFSFLHLGFNFFVLLISYIIILILMKNYCSESVHIISKNISLAFSGLLAVVGYSAVVEWLMSFSRNVKNKSFFRHTLIGYIFFKKEPGTYEHKKNRRNLNIFILLCVGYSGALVFFALLTAWREMFFLPLIFLTLVGAAFLLVSAYYISKLIDHIGQPGEKPLDARLYPVWLRGFADYISKMQKNTNEAIESAVKDQKMKTQLITNVSHDLKTPLTAVINYADLLSKCDIDNEQARDYIAVISEKCDRLKKLIEDLTEAAKASSGNIRANIVSLNLNEIAVQVAGETEDALKAKSLELVLNVPDDPVFVSADGKLTYRILENLMSNVQKYAMPNSRVYLVVGNDKSVYVSNVSAKALNISPEELKARFVRGDESRTTEGSGLGLAIADDLCKIQNAALELSIDGDLFKATVRFETN